MQRKKSLFFSLNDRSYGVRPRGEIRRNILGSNYLVKRLKCEHVFVGHEGCVNTVAWSECGDILLSGSDDCKLNIYRLSSMKPVHSIQSGHRANVFSAKFLPCTGNTKIVSCSGDGILHYNDVNSQSSYGKNPFCCHAGTTYEVNTTPTEPHTFLSSGEDGTVRLFDLRSKTKCVCEGCREDVLIDCEKAVTSFSVNPVYPYYLAVGCENSMLRVYDRRSLSTDGQGQGSQHNKHHGLLYQFKPKALEQRHCRVTSLKYSSDGQSLLASFCSDYVYLFDASPNPPTRVHSGSSSNDERDGSGPHAGSDPPMKRLRLRGDWSDTGPNARPECEDSGTSTSGENNFVQRMSGYLTRWIEESLQNTRRRRHEPSTVRERPEEVPERSIHRDENPESSTAHDSDGSLSEDDDRGEQETGTTTENDVMQGTEMNSGNLEQDGAQTQTCSDSTDVEHVEQPRPPRESYKNGGKACAHGPSDATSGEHSVTSTDTGGRTESSESATKRSRVTRRKKRGSAKHSDEIRTESTTSEPSSGPVLTPEVNNHGNSENRGVDDEQREDNLSQELIGEMDTPQVLRTHEELSSGTQETGSETHHPEVDSPESDFRTQESAHAETPEPAIQESETDVQSSRTRTRGGPSTSMSGEASVGESSESEDDDDDDSDTRRNAAASTIQNFFRFRYKKDSVSNPCGVPVISEARQIYKGHRNARTMIKEANFWGDDFVLSGSDCGRIFIWSRHTAELVMLLEGDRHVVNCVQPHPYDPILATSGIDYDVKLWTPTALNGSRMDNANEIIARNEKMLKESRDTLTVPASFMIRVLSSLHRVRFNAMGNDQTAADSDSDWDEGD